MKITGVKATADPPAPLVQRCCLPPDSPIARERPVVEFQPRRRNVDVRLVPCRATRRREVFAARITHIVLRRLQVAPIGGSFNASALDRNELATNVATSRVGEQLLNPPFRLLVLPFPEMMISNATLCIHEIESRPVFVPERAPYRMLVIHRDRVDRKSV